MREKRRKIPLDVILATPVSEARRKHGMQVYASRLCHRGQYNKAKEYCAKNNLNWPPFTGVPISTGEVLAKLVEQPISDGAREAGPVVREEEKPQEVASCGDVAPSDPPFLPGRSATPDVAQKTGSVGTGGESLAGVTSGAAGEPPTGNVRSEVEPHESRTPAPSRKARIWAFCANPKLIRIKFEDGAKEFGSLWASRPSFRRNDIIDVEVERGTGAGAIWQEVRRKV